MSSKAEDALFVPSADATTSGERKFSPLTLTAMVVGSMVGAGIFSLPATFGRATGPFGALIAWVIAGGGMLMLAFVFQILAHRKPDLDAGIFAYAKAGFGNYLGFLALALTSANTLIPYVLSAGFALKLAHSGQTYEIRPEDRRGDLIRAALAAVYTIFMLFAGGLKYVLLSAIFFAPGTVLFILARREQRVSVFTPAEWVLFPGRGRRRCLRHLRPCLRHYNHLNAGVRP